MKFSKIAFLLLISFILLQSTMVFSKPVSLVLETAEETQPLKSGNGFLLINLEISGAAPSIEFYRINGREQTYLKKDQRIKKQSNKFRLDLKNKNKGFYFKSLPQGLYQITRINVPYFDLPHELDTDNSRDWRFSIVEGMTNYIGKLVIEKERSTKYVNIRLLNRMATEIDDIEEVLKRLSIVPTLRVGVGVRDDFLDTLKQQQGE